jgi:hypothetical protein
VSGAVIALALGKQLKDAVELAYAPDGFIYALDVPLSSLKPAD